MVQLSLAPLKGNHARRFPHQGHLGLSPVKLSGTVQTTIEEDGAALQASSIDVRVRCYEAEWSNGGKALDFSKARTIYQVAQRLWSSTGDLTAPRLNQVPEDPEQQEYRPLGNFKGAWKLTIPVDAIHEGARSSVTYTRWRIWWVLEAVVQHQPKRFHGSHLLRHYHLHLMSHAYPVPSRPLQWKSDPSSDESAAASLIHYDLRLDSNTYSPGQRFTLGLDLKRTSLDPKLSIKKVVVELRREIIMTPPSPTSVSESEGPATPDDTQSLTPAAAADAETSYFARPIPSSASRGLVSTPPLVSSTPGSRSATVDPREDVVSVMTLSSSDVTFNASESAKITLSGFVPRRKTEHHWSLGETSSTQHLAVRFFVAVQIHTKSRNNSIIELPTRDVIMHGVSAEDRAMAREDIQRALNLQERPTTALSGDMRRSASWNDTPSPDLGRRRSSNEDADMEARLRQARKRFASTTVGLDTPLPSPPIDYAPSLDLEPPKTSGCLPFRSKRQANRRSTILVLKNPGQEDDHLALYQQHNSLTSKTTDDEKAQVYDQDLSSPAAYDFSNFSFQASNTDSDRSSPPSSASSAFATPPSPPMRFVQKLRAKSKERSSISSTSSDSTLVTSRPRSQSNLLSTSPSATPHSSSLKSTPFNFFRRASRQGSPPAAVAADTGS